MIILIILFSFIVWVLISVVLLRIGDFLIIRVIFFGESCFIRSWFNVIFLVLLVKYKIDFVWVIILCKWFFFVKNGFFKVCFKVLWIFVFVKLLLIFILIILLAIVRWVVINNGFLVALILVWSVGSSFMVIWFC